MRQRLYDWSDTVEYIGKLEAEIERLRAILQNVALAIGVDDQEFRAFIGIANEQVVPSSPKKEAVISPAALKAATKEIQGRLYDYSLDSESFCEILARSAMTAAAKADEQSGTPETQKGPA